jgi:hypothetical protein
VAINEGTRARLLAVRAAGPRGPASLERLQAPGLSASQGITLGGQSFGTTTATGSLAGRLRAVSVAPSRGGGYRFSLPGASAAMLTLPAG